MSSVNAPNMHSFPPQHLMEFNNNDFLLTQIKNQVEFYFAPQNLQHDRFLQSHLSATDHLGAVSIHVICSFPKIRQLYSYSRSAYYPHDVDMPADPALLRMALATSSVVSLSHDGMWVVPNVQKDAHKDTATEATVASVPSSPSSSQEGSTHQDRNTVVLNNIADTVTETTILEAFAKFNPKGARPEPDSNTWHVFFGSAEDAAASLEAEIKVNDTLVVGSLKVGMPTVPNLPLPPPAQPTPMMVNGNVMDIMYSTQCILHRNTATFQCTTEYPRWFHSNHTQCNRNTTLSHNIDILLRQGNSDKEFRRQRMSLYDLIHRTTTITMIATTKATGGRTMETRGKESVDNHSSNNNNTTNKDRTNRQIDTMVESKRMMTRSKGRKTKQSKLLLPRTWTSAKNTFHRSVERRPPHPLPPTCKDQAMRRLC